MAHLTGVIIVNYVNTKKDAKTPKNNKTIKSTFFIFNSVKNIKNSLITPKVGGGLKFIIKKSINNTL